MFEITSTASCSYCKKAKELLDANGLPWREALLETYEQRAAFKMAGFTTVPQIYHNGSHIGGYEELVVWIEKNNVPRVDPKSNLLYNK